MADAASIPEGEANPATGTRVEVGPEPLPVERTANGCDRPGVWVEQLDGVRRFQIQKQRAMQLGLDNPYFRVHDPVTPPVSTVSARASVTFSSYNYLGLSTHPEVNRAACDAIRRYGTSVSASRLASGERPLHGELERALARWVGTEDAVTFVGGHATNVTTIGHLFGDKDLVVYDALIHNSVVQGATLSRARQLVFPHNDWETLDRMLALVRRRYRRVLIAVEGVYSMDGDIADLPRFLEVKKRHDALLLVDEAHSIGVLGGTGRGIGEHFGIDRADVDLWMGTLSKALASCGGYIAGPAILIEYLRYTAPGFVYSVGISPPNAAAALAALRILEREPERLTRLHANARLFLACAREHGLNTGNSGGSGVVPVFIGDSLRCWRLSTGLFDRGIDVQPVLAPAVGAGKERLRFFLTSEHTEEQIRHAVAATGEVLAGLQA